MQQIISKLKEDYTAMKKAQEQYDATYNSLISILESTNEGITESPKEVTPQAPKKVTPKKTKDIDITSPGVVAFAKENNVTLDPAISGIENFDNICKQLKTNIKITDDKREKTIYQCKEEYPKIQNYVITAKTLENRNVKSIASLQHYNAQNEPEKSKNEIKHYNEFKEHMHSILPGNTNIKTSNNTHVATNLVLFSVFDKVAADPLTEYEIEANLNAKGAPTYIKNTNLELETNCYSYDINAHHPYILGKTDFKFPLRQGKSIHINDISEIDKNKLGFYALKVNQEDLKYFSQKDTSQNRKKIFYTNYDIQCMDLMEVPYTLLGASNENIMNATIYEDYDCVYSKELFGPTIDKLYSIKSNPMAKSVLQMLLGKTTQVDKQVSTNISDEIDIDNININEDEIVETTIFGFKHNHARMKLFFYSYLKLDMYITLIKDKKYEVLRIKSDSILINKNLADNSTLLGTEIGKLKREGFFEKGLVYPHVNHSFKTKPQKKAHFWNGEEYIRSTELETDLETDDDDE